MNLPASRQNNYVLLRLLLAISILLTHSYALWNTPNLDFIAQIFKARISVDAFFIISGFFIFKSYERSSSISLFLKKRFLRIYPGYITALVLMVIMSVIITKGQLLQSPLILIKYFVVNLFTLNFLQPGLPGVFENNHHTALNSALWTLKVEITFYLSIPILAFFLRRWNRSVILILFYVLSVAYAMTFNSLHASSGDPLYYTLARQFPGKLCMFVCGAFLAYHLEYFKKYALLLLFSGIMGIYVWWNLNIYPLYPISLSLILIYLGTCFKYMGDVKKFADLSVGIFMYHCPVMQVLILSGKFAHSPVLGLMVGMGIVFVMAYGSWHLVEKRFLAFK